MPTRLGWTLLALLGGIAFAAINTGNNLLYLLVGIGLAALLVSGYAAGRGMAGVSVELSHPEELRLRLRWLAILSASYPGKLAASGGIHDTEGVVKALMAGAAAVQVVSVLLTRGIEHLAVLRQELASWLIEHEYTSLRQLQGSMNLAGCPNPGAYERAQYMRILQSRHGE